MKFAENGSLSAKFLGKRQHSGAMWMFKWTLTKEQAITFFSG